MSRETTALIDPSNYSVVMVFRLAEIAGFRRLLDVSGGDHDSGLYDFGGQVVLYPDIATIGDPVLGAGTYFQVALTSESTGAGSERSNVYVNGRKLAETRQPLSLTSDGLRLFKDNEQGGGNGEESAGALACLLVYDGALTSDEIARQAAGVDLCPATRPPSPGFRAGTYVGTTSQGLPITIIVGRTSVDGISFHWRARCADGRVHTNEIVLGGGNIRHRRFSVGGTLNTGARARISGKLRGSHASGRLSRRGNSAFDTVCVARGIRWQAHLVRRKAAV
jgi:hypothetical protein